MRIFCRFRGAKAEAQLIRARLLELEERRRAEPAARRGEQPAGGSAPNTSAAQPAGPVTATSKISALEVGTAGACSPVSDIVLTCSTVKQRDSDATQLHCAGLPFKSAAPEKATPIGISVESSSLENSSARSALAAEAARIRAEVEAARRRAEDADRELQAAQQAKEREEEKEALDALGLAIQSNLRLSFAEEKKEVAESKEMSAAAEEGSQSSAIQSDVATQELQTLNPPALNLPTASLSCTGQAAVDDLLRSENEASAVAKESVDYAVLPVISNEAIESETRECNQGASECRPASLDLHAGLVEWAQELGLKVVSPVVTSSARTAEIGITQSGRSPKSHGAMAAEDTYLDESFEQDDESEDRPDHRYQGVVRDSGGLSALSVCVWADSGPEVFEFPSGAGEMEDAGDSLFVPDASDEINEPDESGAENAPNNQLPEGLLDSRTENPNSTLDERATLDGSRADIVNDESEPKEHAVSNQPTDFKSWYSAFDDDETAEVAADEAATYFADMILSDVVLHLAAEIGADVCNEYALTATSTASATLQGAIPVAAILSFFSEVQAELPSSPAKEALSSDMAEETASEATDADLISTSDQSEFHSPEPPPRLPSPPPTALHVTLHSPKTSAEPSCMPSAARSLFGSGAESAVNEAKPISFLVGPARSDDPNHPLRFTRPCRGSESCSSFLDSVADEGTSLVDSEINRQGGIDARLGKGEAESLRSSVEAAVLALQVARASSSMPAACAVVQALREAQNRIAEVLAAVDKDPEHNQQHPLRSDVAAGNLVQPSSSASASSGLILCPSSSGLPSARSSVSSSYNGGNGGGGPDGGGAGRTRLGVNLSSISGVSLFCQTLSFNTQICLLIFLLQCLSF